jgi:hypothetical protein
MTSEEKELIQAIQAALSPDLIPKDYRGRTDNPMFGHCYHASEALYRSLGGKTSGYKAQRGVDNDGVSHWWVESPTGEILDPTAAQYTDFDKTPPYHNAKGASFRRTSGRAKTIMERISNPPRCSAPADGLRELLP